MQEDEGQESVPEDSIEPVPDEPDETIELPPLDIVTEGYKPPLEERGEEDEG